MLINKFRIKYSVKAELDNFDAIIRDEVEALMQSNNVSEAELIRLDKKL